MLQSTQMLKSIWTPAFRPVMGDPPMRGEDLSKAVRKLFANGEQGGMYDFTSPEGLYQDASGTTPVTAVGQPVGLVLDRRFGLERGPELVVNGDLSSGTTGWAASGVGVTIAASNGRLRLETPFANGIATQFVPTVAGRAYEISFVWWGTSNTVSNTLVAFGAASSPPLSGISPAPGTRIRFIAYAVAESTRLDLRVSGGAEYWAEYANISVREIPGNHLSQATTAARPTYTAQGARHDGVDDFLQAALAEDWTFLHDGSGGTLGISGSWEGEPGTAFTGTQGGSTSSRGVSQGLQGSLTRANWIVSSGDSRDTAVAAVNSWPGGVIKTLLLSYEEPAAARWEDGARGADLWGDLIPSNDPPSNPLRSIIAAANGSIQYRRRIIAISRVLSDPELALVNAWLMEGTE